jgi:glycosyltransferase involved in cell wall biosynthesis
MKIAINFATNTSGGGRYHVNKFLLSIDDSSFANLYFIFNHCHRDLGIEENCIYVDSPARSFRAKRQIKLFLKHHCIDVIYTMAGPSYCSFDIPHILGLSNAWILRENKLLLRHFFRGRTFLYEHLRIQWQRLNVSRSASMYVFQSQESERAHISDFPFMEGKTALVPNALAAEAKVQNTSCTFDVLVPGTYYPHKGVEEIYQYAVNLPYRDFTFTLHDDSWQVLIKRYGEYAHIKNIGRYAPENEILICGGSNVVILNSYIETISGTALSAAFAGTKVVARNINANKSIFGDSIPYYDSVVELELILNSNMSIPVSKYPLVSYRKRVTEILDIILKCVE